MSPRLTISASCSASFFTHSYYHSFTTSVYVTLTFYFHFSFHFFYLQALFISKFFFEFTVSTLNCLQVWECATIWRLHMCVDSIRHGWYRWSRSVLRARRAILFPWLAVWLAGWVSYFWMTRTHTHIRNPVPPLPYIVGHNLWWLCNIWTFHHSMATKSLLMVLQHIVSRPPLPRLFFLFSVGIFLFSWFCFFSGVVGIGHISQLVLFSPLIITFII